MASDEVPNKERRGRMARNFQDARKFIASRIFLEIRMAIEELS